LFPNFLQDYFLELARAKPDKLDFFFIDEDHTYDRVKQDFEMYSKLVRPGGIIGFHDIFPGPPETVGGVPRFWDEVKSDLDHIEVIAETCRTRVTTDFASSFFPCVR